MFAFILEGLGFCCSWNNITAYVIRMVARVIFNTKALGGVVQKLFPLFNLEFKLAGVKKFDFSLKKK